MKYNPFKYWWKRTTCGKLQRVGLSVLTFTLGALIYKGSIETSYFLLKDSRVIGGLFTWLFCAVIFGTFRGIISLLIVWGCYKNNPNAKIAYYDYIEEKEK